MAQGVSEGNCEGFFTRYAEEAKTKAVERLPRSPPPGLFYRYTLTTSPAFAALGLAFRFPGTAWHVTT
jgi:hypothetical protein